MNTTRYTDIANLSKDFNVNSISTYVPKPNQNDFNAGYITRYFVQKSNDVASTVYEINSAMFTHLSHNAFFTTVDLDWQIVGTDEHIKEVNFKSVQFAARTLPAVRLYLPYFLQYRQ